MPRQGNPFWGTRFDLGSTPGPTMPPVYTPDEEFDPDAPWGGEEEESQSPFAPPDLGPGIGISNYGVTDLKVLYDSVVATNQDYRNRALQIPAKQLEAEKFLLGQLSTQKRWEAGQEAKTQKEGVDLAVDLKKMADANARSAASIGSANARNAANIAASWERSMLSQQGQTFREEMTQAGQTERKLADITAQSEEADKQRQFLGQENAADREIKRIQNEIALGNLNLNSALGQLDRFLQAQQFTIPQGAEYIPGFEPGGGVQEASRLAGVGFNPQNYRANPVPFDPAALVKQTMGR